MAAPTALDAEQTAEFLERHQFHLSIECDDIAFYAGDVRVEQLPLEANSAILVDGDLVVEKTLFDHGAYNEDEYGFLLVTGRVVCRSLIWGGSPLRAHGGIDVSTFAYHNGWGLSRIEAGPLLTSPILLAIDNEVAAKELRIGHVFIRFADNWQGETMPLARGLLRDDIFIQGRESIDVGRLRQLADDGGSPVTAASTNL